MHLDTVCTMVDRDAVVMYPPLADALVAFTALPGENGSPEVAGPEPFLAAAARAMEIDALRVIDTGLDPVTAEREQWDDGNNTLALAPGLVVAYERNTETNARLEDARRRGRSASPGASSAPAAAGRAACPAPSCATARRLTGRARPARRRWPTRSTPRSARGLAHYAPPGHKRAPRARRRRAAGARHHAAHGRRGPVGGAAACCGRPRRRWRAPGTGTGRGSRCTGSTLANQAALLAARAARAARSWSSRAAHKSLLAGLVISGLDPGLGACRRRTTSAASCSRSGPTGWPPRSPRRTTRAESSWSSRPTPGCSPTWPALADGRARRRRAAAGRPGVGRALRLPPRAAAQRAPAGRRRDGHLAAQDARGVLARAPCWSPASERVDAGRLATAFDEARDHQPVGGDPGQRGPGARADGGGTGASCSTERSSWPTELRRELAELPGVRWSTLTAAPPSATGTRSSSCSTSRRAAATGASWRGRCASHGVQLAMADQGHLVALLSIGDDEAAHARLVAGLRDALAAGRPHRRPRRRRAGAPGCRRRS